MTSSLSFMSMVSFGFTSMLQSGFSDSSFVGLYLLLVLTLIVGYCLYTLLRSERTAPSGLSVKAALIIIGKQLLPSLILVSLLTLGISLLYVLLARPQLPEDHLLIFWLGPLFGIVALASFIIWLIRRYLMWQPQQAPAQLQALPLLQQRRKLP